MKNFVRMVMLSAVAVAMFVGTVSAQQKGTLTDSRDGQNYKTVTIGNQTWMAENLRFKIGDSWCYDNSEDNCNKYGRMYDWNMAKIACPKGWHLPSNDEWTELVTVVGSSTAGKKLKSRSGWNENGNGTDEYGFSALPSGYRYLAGGFENDGVRGYWWTATEHDSNNAYQWNIDYNHDYVNKSDSYKGVGYSVRCVKTD
jgi:uncharacterized protein (TIGR02145 family)